ncbi:MAG: DUF3052 domain-containing protein [Longimicrobiales bacterium]
MLAGYSGTPLPKKLGIKEGHRVAIVRGPRGFKTGLELPESVRVDTRPTGKLTYDVVVAFAADLAALDGLIDRLKPSLTWAGGLWTCWPKRSSPLVSDIIEADVRASGLATGLVDNKICAIDSDWSGLRFVHRKENRPK